MKQSEVCTADLRLSADQLNEIIYGTELPYIVFDENPEGNKSELERFLAAVPQEAVQSDAVRITGKSKFIDGGNKVRDLSLYRKFPGKSGMVDMTKEFHCVPVVLQGSVFSTAAIKAAGLRFDSRFEFLKEELFSVQFSERYPKYYFISKHIYQSKRKPDENLSPPQSYEAGWYLEASKPLWDAISSEGGQALPSKRSQYAFLYLNMQRFQSNRKEAGKQIFESGEDLRNYLAEVMGLMNRLDPDVIAKAGRSFNLTLGDVEFMTGKRAKTVADIDTIHVKSLRYREDLEGGPCLEFFLYTRDSSEETFDFYIREEAGGKKQDIKAELTPVMTDMITFFSKDAYELHAYHVTVPMKKGDRKKLAFVLVDPDGKEKTCKMGFDGNWQSRLLKNSKGAYWAAGGNLLRCSQDRILIEPGGGLRHFAAEIRMLLYLAYKNYVKKELPPNVLKWRIHYWLTRSKYKNRRIWLYYDKLNDAGDNAEYAFRYAYDQDDGIEKYFFQNEGTRDYKRLSAAGYKLLKRGSMEAVMLALNSEALYMTHLPPFKKTGISWQQLQYLKGLINTKIIRLYHGFAGTKQGNYTQIKDDVICVVVGSTWERDFYLQPEYGYTEDMITPSGMPRYDELVDRSKKQIMFAPTWTPALRDAGKNFKNTSYFKTYTEIFANERLQETARRHGYKLAMFLHPMLATRTKDFAANFKDSDVVIAVNSLKDSDYVTMMSESNLMVTDYSSVHFDFAYMRKPVIYYQDPKLTPWREHSFKYVEWGFGEVCYTPEELIDILCRYIENDCAMGDEYRDRANSFFLHDDGFASKRLYEDVRRRLG